jgi:hypothetical protein
MKHPDPARQFKSKPDMTKKDAQRIMRAYRKKDKANSSWRRKEIGRHLDALAGAAKTAKRLELKLVKDPADYQLLKELVTQRTGFVAEQRKGGDALHHNADILEHLDQHIAEAELDGGNNETAARESFERHRQALGNDPDDQQSDDRNADNAASKKETVH